MSVSSFQGLCVRFGLPMPEEEYEFALPRKWRFDWAWLRDTAGNEIKIALEINGGAWKKGTDGQRGGRHNRAAGFLKDMEKLTRAAILGWRVLHVTPRQMENGEVFNLLKEAML